MGVISEKLPWKWLSALKEIPTWRSLPQTSLQFRSAIEHYMSRLDKEWGLTDCASFQLMEEKNMTEALTADHHFKQAGYTILMEMSE